MLNSILSKAETDGVLAVSDMRYLLELTDDADLKALFAAAYAVKRQYVGTKAFFRGIIEFSNICRKDCYYCGIRKSNGDVRRFDMEPEEIIDAAVWAHGNDYGSIVLQSGERCDAAFVDRIESVLLRIRERTNGDLGITLSLGEQERETYRRWFAAGAHRYLLRIETTSPILYAKLHPEDHRLDARLTCLEDLRKVGYQVGTGVMIGLPSQTVDDLIEDILFFLANDIDMIGMGPYIVHQDTPLASEVETFDERHQLLMGLKMIAVTRLVLRDVNIAATTALQALDHQGREAGLQAGANIIMPNVTDTKYRAAYQLYDNKPCTDENSSMCKGCLNRRITLIGESIGFGEWGDSPHYHRRMNHGATAAG
ncbi:MAG: [FeFe] hydrogenase H-cluster radical SAM maturase HydE [Lentisphaerae bacterium]|jgi:biotin synthase|nr:[FeFe] hydrogenase H-cluster radical SAM maturase HydE [Lentisphaerota bacterium]MBT4815936.1 [FeFe] hydrogenase H-cluster radical SAM maturase HydE [Lentisphaerota bacterium]MBT5607239.1 [FeFe] hydrogenase H-cluster radical SAM maturase HydE [Lentisphaerota bacterium]MBT7057349.1 [FeFe] hydrogenase H-cluster radical SAM maturase HydE [Lentisphaerota bacterium]MBT7842635.1 [FeFe] hydrogenase H-cluster radical SAM maturase HydE [Lentisphaerota bacterium]